MLIYLFAVAVLLLTLTGCLSNRHKPDITMLPECLTGPGAYCWLYWRTDDEPLVRVCRSREDIYDPEMRVLPIADPACVALDLDGDRDVDLKDVYERLNR